MVDFEKRQAGNLEILSVLALSSRFDGLLRRGQGSTPPTAFSTRSVESF